MSAIDEIEAGIRQLQFALRKHGLEGIRAVEVDADGYRRLRSIPDINAHAVWIDRDGRNGISIAGVEFIKPA